METIYSIGAIEYTLYQAASGDWCVSVDAYGEDRKDYNLGTRERALEFILEEYED